MRRNHLNKTIRLVTVVSLLSGVGGSLGGANASGASRGSRTTKSAADDDERGMAGRRSDPGQVHASRRTGRGLAGSPVVPGPSRHAEFRAAACTTPSRC